MALVIKAMIIRISDKANIRLNRSPIPYLPNGAAARVGRLLNRSLIPYLPREELQLINAENPYKDFCEFEASIQREISRCFNLSYEQLGREFSKINP